jgi:hypothetical protein
MPRLTFFLLLHKGRKAYALKKERNTVNEEKAVKLSNDRLCGKFETRLMELEQPQQVTELAKPVCR